MAIVDTKSGKIIGAKKGSLTWWHEKGHIYYNNSNVGIRLQLIQSNMLFYTLLGLVIHIYWSHWTVKVFATLSFTTFIGLHFYEELWCWVYAFRKKHKALFLLLANKDKRVEFV